MSGNLIIMCQFLRLFYVISSSETYYVVTFDDVIAQKKLIEKSSLSDNNQSRLSLSVWFMMPLIWFV